MVGRVAGMLPAPLVHAAALATVALLLVSAGQPIFTDDTWWHLAMGEAYLTQGPWLSSDPMLHTATGPAAPAAWLSDVTFYGVERALGFQGLRLLHVMLVAGILGLAWSLLRRSGGSRAFASLAVALFSVLSAYRLFQLRPHLLSVLAGLLLVRLLIVDRDPPSWSRVAASAVLLGLWANLHGGFLLGFVLLAAAVAGLLLDGILAAEWGQRDRLRVRRIAWALALGLLASLANPSGAGQHLLYFAAGSATPELAVVADEWAIVNLFQLPVPNLPPSPLAWAVVWSLLLLTLMSVFLGLRARARAPDAHSAAGIDPALLALAAVSLLALLSAIRLLWLGIVPLLLIGHVARAQGLFEGRPARVFSWAAAATAVALVPGFIALGPWPMISRAIHPSWYARPYAAAKYHAHAVWFLRDAEVEGRLFNDYSDGNFLGYWLAPRLKAFVNGSLNVPREVMDARYAIVRREGSRPGESFGALLDRHQIDAFFGTGVPAVPRPGRPVLHTTLHLEAEPGWILVFRSMESAVYLRSAERNRSNLQRITGYYARQGVPFDPELGFDAERVIREASDWAVTHGLLPVDYRHLRRQARALDPSRRPAARDRLASLYAVIGLHERTTAVDRKSLLSAANTRPGSAAGPEPGTLLAARRLVWSLLHLARFDESLEAAERLEALASREDGLSALLVDAARRVPALSEEEAATLVAVLPVFSQPQGMRVLAGFQEPVARERRQ